MTSRRPLFFILATILIDAIGVGLIFPLMPDLMDRVGAGGAANGAVLGGILMAAYAGTQFLFAPAIGGISDAIGRKPVLITALATLAVDYVIMALATSFELLLIGRLLAGIAGATYITATAYLADISPPDKRAANFGLIGATFGIGFVLGPAIGGVLAGIDVTAPFWVAAGLSALNVLFGLFVLPESLPPEKRRAFTPSDINPFGAIRNVVRMPALVLPIVILVCFEFANMVYPTLWAFWGRANFGWSATIIGASLAAYGVGVAITQGVVLPALLKRVSEERVLVFALVVGGVSAVGFGLMDEVWMVAVVLPIACLSDMAPPSMTAIMANATDEDRQGVLQGVLASLSSLTAIASPLIMTPVFRAFADPEARYSLPGAPFLLAGAIMFVLVPLALRVRNTSRSA